MIVKTFTMKNGNPAIVSTEVTYPTQRDAEHALSLIEDEIRHLFDVAKRVNFGEPDHMGRYWPTPFGWRIRWTGGRS